MRPVGRRHSRRRETVDQRRARLPHRQVSLNQQMTGLIALGVDATGSPNNGAWDGVALAVYLEKRAFQ